MRRRTFLGALAGTATAGTLGVTASSESLCDSRASALAGRDDGQSADPPPCRSFGHGDGSAVCVGDGGPVTVARSTDVVSGGDLVVTLANENADGVGVNEYAWTVYRRDIGGWTQVAPDAFVASRVTLARGESLSWRLATGDGPASDNDDVIIDPLSLESGGHAFVLVAVVDGERREFVAPFAVE